MGRNEIKQRCPQCKEYLIESDYSSRVWGNIGEFCKKCRNSYTRKWRLENHEKTKELQRKSYYKAKAKEPFLNRRRRLKSKYGLSQEDINNMLSKQNGKCLGCLVDLSISIMAIDHNHNTGLVRGLLCTLCNLSLGQVKDNPDTLHRLAGYLERVNNAVG